MVCLKELVLLTAFSQINSTTCEPKENTDGEVWECIEVHTAT